MTSAAAGLPEPDFFSAYYRHLAEEDRRNRPAADLHAAARKHRLLAAHRPMGTTTVAAFTPTTQVHGWSTGLSSIDIVTDDMPFLVDSVTAELSRLGITLHQVIHPVFRVERDDRGELLQVSRSGSRGGLESWMHIDISRQDDPQALTDIEDQLRRVLGDVRQAVDDWPAMRAAAQSLANQLETAAVCGTDPNEARQAHRLLTWLAEGNFTFLGYREYELGQEGGLPVLQAIGGTGLGILRSDHRLSESFARLPAELRARALEPQVLLLTKASARSTVHRPAYLDYVGVKKFDARGQVVGERRFLGLFTSAAYTESVGRIPVIDDKVTQVLEESGFSPESHSGKDLLQILETYPRDELFQTSVAELVTIATSVMHLQERRRTRLFLRRDDFGRYISCLIYLPRDRYTTAVRLRMEEILRAQFTAESVDYTTRVSESALARLHFVVRVPRGETIGEVNSAALERELARATRTWEEDFHEVLQDRWGDQSTELTAIFRRSFPEAYKVDFAPQVAVSDALTAGPLLAGQPGNGPVLSSYRQADRPAEELRLKFFGTTAISLTDVLPVFGDLGVEVLDERPYTLSLADGRELYLYDFGLRYRGVGGWSEDFSATRFVDAFKAVYRGLAESDPLNELILAAGLTWREVALIRTYAKYLRQAGLTFSLAYIRQALVAHADIVQLLLKYFLVNHDPNVFMESDGRAGTDREAAAQEQHAAIIAALDAVTSIDFDRILRSFLAAISATLRTNYFRPAPHAEYLAVKLNPQEIPDLPHPRPAFEVWVYAPRFEGVHLRFGLVARGGLRWSDRPEDFRTEILGLVKAQLVKNAVIVPTGAKGGFVAKRLPPPGDRTSFLAEGVACYQMFISALLDLTDNLDEERKVVPAASVVRHDGDDPYLVVAADKGTATFSDLANEISTSHGFWLDDAFASGGSTGYDHKAMGITARGAWESVKRHFRELSLDTQQEEFTVVGVGDMSGDVFGNGMLLSPHIRLVAAFDHRHIFIDPEPVAARGFAERRRLFDVPRSSWADYDAEQLSPGGGIWPRSAKSIPLSAAAAAALGLGDGPLALPPNEVLRAILLAPVDLLWNGGIGTYVKASVEGSVDVGDRANDAIRVNGHELRCRVVGEGGNLGLTQLGRIEAARHGVRVNTDAIDNSAGVDTSDYEVNIKILLNAAVDRGELSRSARDELLARMTDEVARLVLRDNYEQNVLLGNAREQDHMMLTVHQRFISRLVTAGQLDRALEFLPSDAEMKHRREEGMGLRSPEFAVLVAYAKNTLADELLASSLPDDPWLARTLRSD
ncbi:MAG: NAD-glutamate dehydrogenase, partial [Angustibacter sp.]